MRLFHVLLTMTMALSLSGCSTFERPEFLKLHLDENNDAWVFDKDGVLLKNLEELEKEIRNYHLKIDSSEPDCPKCPPCKPCP